MPKKRKKSKSKSKKKAKGPEIDRKYCVETQTDLNRRLAKLRKNSNILDNRRLELKLQLENLEDERRAVVIQLQKQISKQVKLVEEINIRITEIEDLRKYEMVEFSETIDALEDQYLKTFVILESDLRMLFYKYYSLERVSVDRDRVFDIVDEQRKISQLQQQKHSREIYEIEKRNVVEKNILKQEVKDNFEKIDRDYKYSSKICQSVYSRDLWQKHNKLRHQLSVKVQSNMKLRPKFLQFEANENELNINVEASEGTLRYLERMLDKRTNIFNHMIESYSHDLSKYVQSVQYKKFYCSAVAEGSIINEKTNNLTKKYNSTEKFVQKAKIQNEELAEQHKDNVEYIINLKKILIQFKNRAKLFKSDIESLTTAETIDQDSVNSMLANKHLFKIDLIELVSHIKCTFHRVPSIHNVTIDKYQPGDLNFINPHLFEPTDDTDVDYYETMDSASITNKTETTAPTISYTNTEGAQTAETSVLEVYEDMSKLNSLFDDHLNTPVTGVNPATAALIPFNVKKESFQSRLSIGDNIIDFGKITIRPEKYKSRKTIEQLERVSLKLGRDYNKNKSI